MAGKASRIARRRHLIQQKEKKASKEFYAELHQKSEREKTARQDSLLQVLDGSESPRAHMFASRDRFRQVSEAGRAILTRAFDEMVAQSSFVAGFESALYADPMRIPTPSVYKSSDMESALGREIYPRPVSRMPTFGLVSETVRRVSEGRARLYGERSHPRMRPPPSEKDPIVEAAVQDYQIPEGLIDDTFRPKERNASHIKPGIKATVDRAIEMFDIPIHLFPAMKHRA